uniref:Uncharacterized protein n=1 Tax=Arundo donax TaxID=35708 RepID=A0A0A8XSA2_ARUDO
MVAQEMKRTWHGTWSSLAMGMTWEASVTSVTTAETRGAAAAMSGPRRCAERRSASQRSTNGSSPGNSEASNGRRGKSTRRMRGNAAKRPEKWSASAADTVGRTVTTETSTPWLESAAMTRKKGSRCPMPALGMNMRCGAPAPPSSPGFWVAGWAIGGRLTGSAAVIGS